MKISRTLSDLLQTLACENTDFFNLEWHRNKNTICLMLKKDNEARCQCRYNLTIDNDQNIEGVELELVLPNRNSLLWNDNGYPLQSSTIYHHLDPIKMMIGEGDLMISHINADMGSISRIHCVYDNGILSIEVSTKPIIETTIRIKLAERV